MMHKVKAGAMNIRRGGIAEMQNKRRPYDRGIPTTPCENRSQQSARQSATDTLPHGSWLLKLVVGRVKLDLLP